MRAIKAVLTAIVLSFVLVACSDDGSNTKILAAKEGVLMIVAEQVENGQEGTGLGTGFFIGDNVIITNNHVVADSKSIKVALESSPAQYEAEVVQTDPVADLAVIKIKDWDKFSKENDYKILKFADPRTFVVTQEVYAVGHPWGLLWTVSRGILSAVDRKISEGPKVLIQTDAHVYNGNSGGPLLNEDGEVMGVNSLMMAQNGGSYGFALPVDMIQKVLHDFKTYGAVRWAFLGVVLDETGTVKEVKAGGPAEKAGVKAGDVIVSFTTSNGEFSAKTKSLAVAMATHDPEKPVDLVVKRGEDLLSLPVQPGWKSSQEFQDPSPRP